MLVADSGTFKLLVPNTVRLSKSDRAAIFLRGCNISLLDKPLAWDVAIVTRRIALELTGGDRIWGEPKMRRWSLNVLAAGGLIAMRMIVLVEPASAITVEIEFVGNHFFSQNAQAVAAIEAAADHVGSAITSSLTPIDQVNFSDTVGNTTATLDWSFSFRDQFTDEPIGNLPTVVSDPLLATDTVKVFVDAQLLDGIVIGQGVPAGAQAEIGATILGPGPLNGDAIQGVAGLADSEMNRNGEAALIGVLFGGVDNLGGVDVNPVQFRTAFGGIALDIDSNDDDQADTAQQLQDFWHLDHTTAVEAGKFDLFSVAVTEIVTALGFGTSDSFDELASGRDWLGAEVIDLLGTGEDVLDPLATNSILEGTVSTRASDGAAQAAALDPNIQAGAREELTALDLAFLRDLGFETIAGAAITNGDFDNDGDVDGEDFLVWQRGESPSPLDLVDLSAWQTNFGVDLPAFQAATTVPEPSSTMFVLFGSFVVGSARYRISRG